MSEIEADSLEKIELDNGKFHKRLLKWYDENKREMPWRDNVLSTDEDKGNAKAYSVWVSEIMLQQTKVETVKGYYLRWMSKFPTVSILSKASDDEVNSSWAGLGYYSRARNLHKAAKHILNELNGSIPSDFEGLKTLPGVGPYTAGAIASVAFGKPSPVVDGNVIRVFSRWFKQNMHRDDRKLHTFCWNKAEELMNTERPGDWNQALMELGATVCSPTKPSCDLCPMNDLCVVYKDDRENMNLYPKPKTPKVVPVEQYNMMILSRLNTEKKREFFLRRRPKTGLLANQLEFLAERIHTETPPKDSKKRKRKQQVKIESSLSTLCLRCLENVEADGEKVVDLGRYVHVFSHLKHDIEISLVDLAEKSQDILEKINSCCLENLDGSWMTVEQLRNAGLTKTSTVCLKKAEASLNKDVSSKKKPSTTLHKYFSAKPKAVQTIMKPEVGK